MRVNIVEEAIDHIAIIHGLSHDHGSTGLDLGLEAAHFAIEVDCSGLGATGQEKLCALAVDDLARWVDAPVEAIHKMQQLDRVHVKHGGCLGVVAHLWWVARDDDQVAEAHDVVAQDIALQTEQVAVAATQVHDDLGSCFCHDLVSERGVRHTHRSTRAVGDVHDIDSGLAQHFHNINLLGDIQARGRIDLDGHDKVLGALGGTSLGAIAEAIAEHGHDLGSKLGPPENGHGLRAFGILKCGFFVRGAAAAVWGYFLARSRFADSTASHAHCGRDGGDVRGTTSAAAAEGFDADFQEAASKDTKILRGARINVAMVELARIAGIGLRNHRERRALHEHLNNIVGLRRPEGAVHPNHISAPAAKQSSDLCRWRAIAQGLVLAKGHLGNNASVVERASNHESDVDLVE
eukprot:comp8753_c0_seq1/m.9748 comp8753_c0_seq1/g.9748  ORF comp8753_c0_seq1/g.9748 comp8753_c0_seq1/m.9748 type:complete len:406 (+) comp8753_c0_seq1:398-1615(+)